MSEKTMTEVRPALTAEQWATREVDSGSGYIHLANTHGRGELSIIDRRDKQWIRWRIGSGMVHALAALALHEQDFGFTHEDVERLRLVAEQCDATRRDRNRAYVLRDLANRIAALLPPTP